MVFVGIVILLLSFYINGSSATWLFLQTIPLCYKNGYAIDYPGKMAIFFPVTIFLFRLIPRGYWGYYIACNIMIFGSLYTWIEFAVAFIFLPISWWWFIGFCVVTFVAGLFIPKEMELCMKSTGPLCFLQTYIPKRKF